jgi:hypothetical protein
METTVSGISLVTRGILAAGCSCARQGEDLELRVADRILLEPRSSVADFRRPFRWRLVHVCAPLDQHRCMPKERHAPGKHVQCEKPIARSIELAEALACLNPSTPHPQSRFIPFFGRMTATGEWSYMQGDLMVFMAKAICAEGMNHGQFQPARPFGIGCWLDGWRRVRKPDLLPVHASPLLARQEMGVLDTVFSREIPWVIYFITSH